MGRLPLAFAAAVALLSAGGALASASPLEDGALGGLPFTGAAHSHPSAVHVNPAGIGLAGRGLHLYLGGHLQADQLSVDRRLVDPATGEEEPGPSGKATTLTPSGMFALYYGGSDISLALASFAPMAERFPEDPAFRYHSRGGHHYQWTLLALAGSWRIGRVILGASLGLGNVTSLRVKYSRDRALDGGSAGVGGDCGGVPCGFENPAAEQRYRVNVSSTDLAFDDKGDWYEVPGGIFLSIFSAQNLSLSAGILYEVSQDWWLGVGYQGPPGVLGARELSGDVWVQDAAIDGGFTRTGRAEINYGLPHAMHLAVRGPLYSLPGWDLTLGMRMLYAEPHHQFDIRVFGGDLGATVPEWQPRHRGFDVSVRTHAGIERQESARLRLGARFSFETSTIYPYETTPLQMAGPRLQGAGALEWRLAPPVVLGAAYSLAFLPTIDAPAAGGFDPRAQVACVDSGFDQDQCEATREGRGLATADGSYDRLLHIMTVSLRWDFL